MNRPFIKVCSDRPQTAGVTASHLPIAHWMGVLLATLIACSVTLAAEDIPASRTAAPEELRLWVDARAGTGKPVHWIAEGGVYEYPSGKKLFGMIGFDSSTVVWPDEQGGEVMHFTRKTFAYTDPQTGEVLTEHNGQPVEVIA